MNNDGAGQVPYEWTIADRLRKSRELTGLSQEEFAILIGISKGTVSTYETDPGAPHKKPFLLAWSMNSVHDLGWIVTGVSSSSLTLTDTTHCASMAPPDVVPTEWVEAAADVTHPGNFLAVAL